MKLTRQDGDTTLRFGRVRLMWYGEPALGCGRGGNVWLLSLWRFGIAYMGRGRYDKSRGSAAGLE